jgi:hypothetical protein
LFSKHQKKTNYESFNDTDIHPRYEPGVSLCMATDTDDVGFAPVGVSPNEVPTHAVSMDLIQPHDVLAGIVITISCEEGAGGKPVVGSILQYAYILSFVENVGAGRPLKPKLIS